METPRHFRAKGRPGGKPLYYWQPSPKLRSLGFGERRLADELARALVECEAFNREADEYRHKAARGVFADAPAGSIRALVAHYRSHDDFLLLAPKTRQEYARCLDLIRMKMGDVAVKQVTPAIVQALKRAFSPTPVQANHVLRTLRLLMSFARREGMVQHNPVSHFRQYRERPRQQVWSDTDERRFLAVCGPELALVYLVAVNTAQRQADVLALPWSAYDGRVIRLRQAKTGHPVEVPAAARLIRLLESTPKVSPIICTTVTGRPWKADHLRHAFKAAMDRAGLAGLRFQDLRRTAIVRMAEAGCTVPEIVSVSGHKIETCQRIVDVYLPATRLLAHSAIIKLDAHRPRD